MRRCAGHLSDGTDAGFDDVLGLAAPQQKVSQKKEEKSHAGGGQPRYALHPKVYGQGVYSTDYHQDSDGKSRCLRQVEYTA